MAHPDIMHQRPAIAEVQRIAQHPGRRLIVAVIIGSRHADLVRWQHDIADLEHSAGTITVNLTDLDPAIFAGWQQVDRCRIVTDRGQ